MRGALEAIGAALFIVGLHLLAAVLVTYVPWVAWVALATFMILAVYAALYMIGAIKIDLSRLRQETSHRG